MRCVKTEISRVCHKYEDRRCQEQVPVWQLAGTTAYFFVSKLAIDVDGAPRAYHPLDKRRPDNHTKALDWLTSLSPSDRHGIQGQEDDKGPEPGFIISGTSLENTAYPTNDTRHWVDAEAIPYIVLTGNFPSAVGRPNVKLGDCAMVIDLSSGKMSGAIYADSGHAVGEGSLKLAKNLDLDPTASRLPPKVTGFDRVNFLHITFPGAHISPPWPVDEIQRVATESFNRWGGMQQVRICFPEVPA
jgi:hypothetical protein